VAGIYIHIPFCKQACHYCDFHFSTSVKKKHELVQSLCRELELRKSELTETVETIYFGGGTPSLLTAEELDLLLECVDTNYSIIDSPEITLEANPDDLTPEKIRELSDSKVNRLSIGIQSFFEEDLKMMNRAHNVKEALECIKNAIPHFKNISVDLIYGIPGMARDRWLENIRTAISLGVPHLSCYALTIEPKTALDNFIKKGLMAPMDDALAQEHYTILIEETEKMGFINYEFSNFGKEGYQSQNNMAYW
jgi:oxygen-independent coproporphyrinogen-3 oxidase